jgi:hypothetical protein
MNLNQWKKKGSIAIWRYHPINKNFPGWHMTACTVGYHSLLEYLSLLDASPLGSYRTIKLDRPDVWSASSKLKKTGELKVIISLIEANDFWQLVNEEGKLFVTISKSNLNLLTDGIRMTIAGEYDFSVGKTSGQHLWFW